MYSYLREYSAPVNKMSFNFYFVPEEVNQCSEHLRYQVTLYNTAKLISPTVFIVCGYQRMLAGHLSTVQPLWLDRFHCNPTTCCFVYPLTICFLYFYY